MQNPETRRRAIVAALIAVGVIAVLAIAVFSGGDDNDRPTPVADIPQNDTLPDTSGQQPEGASGVELGSMIVTAFRCSEKSTPDSECKTTGTVDLSKFTMVLPDGQEVSLDNAMRMDDGSYQWLNIPTGEYTLLAINVAGPADLGVRNIAGSVTPSDGGWKITNSDPNQPVMVDILFAPGEGSPAAG